ncbi:hypothetical protein [Pseudoruegeria sp. SHC-113]|uniref:hypothetical protein n=1 Tax=Pseudoruegeria sp. SHC-113 TaxID=2855439 RepID=UPI0021BB3BE1|nr:hypothetical protein [Pseudoruegeria sp. SHC-113]MCT8158641.1 hypothetical protein [Pseudoruegeria sp. SHC-113]
MVTLAFGLFYVAALFVFLVGTFGWFGQAQDPLSGVYLLPLGLPWVALGNMVPEGGKAFFAAAAPAINLSLLILLCRVLKRR